MPETNNTETDNTLPHEIIKELQITPFITRDTINTMGYLNDTDPYQIYAEIIYMQRCKCLQSGMEFNTIYVDDEEVLLLENSTHRVLKSDTNTERTERYIWFMTEEFENYLENEIPLTHKQIFIKIINTFYLTTYYSSSTEEEIMKLTEMLNLNGLKDKEMIKGISKKKNIKALEKKTLELITSNRRVPYQEAISNFLDYYILRTATICSKFDTLENTINKLKTEEPDYDYLLELLEKVIITQ